MTTNSDAMSDSRLCPDKRVCVGGCAPDLCARTELIDKLMEKR